MQKGLKIYRPHLQTNCNGPLVYLQPLKMRFSPSVDGYLRFRWHPATGRIEDLLEEEAAEETSGSSGKNGRRRKRT